jgi:hypothetical protein
MKNLLFNLVFFTLYSIGEAKTWPVSTELEFHSQRPIKCQVFFSLETFQKLFPLRSLEGALYKSEMKASLVKEIRKFGGRFIEIQNQKRPLPVFIKDVTIEALDKSGDSLSQCALKDVDVTLTLFYTYTRTSQNLQLRSLLKEKVKLSVLATDRQSYYLGSALSVINWPASKLESAKLGGEEKLVETVSLSQKEGAVYTWSLIFVIMLFIWVAFDNRRLAYSIVFMCILVGILLPMVVDLSLKQTESVYTLPNEGDLEKLMNFRLNEVYRGPSAADPAMLFERLQKASTGEFLNKTFVQLFRAKVESPGTMSLVEHIDLQECRLINTCEVECLWQLRAHVFHEGHIHEKDLFYKACFEMKRVEGRWLICQGVILTVYKEARL